MHCEPPLLFKPFFAEAALIRPLAVVDPLVGGAVALLDELFGAIRASKRPFTGMQSLVDVAVVLLNKRKIAV